MMIKFVVSYTDLMNSVLFTSVSCYLSRSSFTWLFEDEPYTLYSILLPHSIFFLSFIVCALLFLRSSFRLPFLPFCLTFSLSPFFFFCLLFSFFLSVFFILSASSIPSYNHPTFYLSSYLSLISFFFLIPQTLPSSFLSFLTLSLPTTIFPLS